MYENLWLDRLSTTEQRENMVLALSREGVREGSSGVYFSWTRCTDMAGDKSDGAPSKMAIWIVTQK